MVAPLLFLVLLGCFVSWIITHILLVVRLGSEDNRRTQHHHTHTGVVPRIGGVGMVTAFGLIYLLCFIFLDNDDNASLIHYAVTAGGVGAFLLGFVDDFRPISAKFKFIIQILLALLAYQSGLSIERVGVPFTDILINFGVFGVFLTVFWFVAIMNLINLIDGLDGLAGGIGLMLMLLLVYLSLQKGLLIPAILSLGMAGALVGFLFHNFPPAKVYMGDSGAYLIGYLIAAFSLMNAEKGTVLAALLAPMLALALPIADVSFAMLRRGIQGLPMFRPDRQHIHHQLLRTGLSHRNTVLVLYCISLLALFGGILVFTWQGRFLPLFLGFAFAIILIVLRGQKISVESLRTVIGQSLQSRQEMRNAISLQQWFVLEIERIDSGQSAWTDYYFVLKKMGFCRAELIIENEERSFFIPGTPHGEVELLLHEEFSVDDSGENRLVLYGERDNFSEQQFTLLCDIAIEAWAKGAVRWQEINGSKLNFKEQAMAKEDYRLQRARNLYRPTY
jgi:UDP-GlcNAc:undecaprenyl-phosphate GlcNAc-1-phosphate transferase